MGIRNVEKIENGVWVATRFKDLVKGDVYRMYESTGEPVEGKFGGFVFRAKDDAYMHSGIWTIGTEEVNE